DPAFPDEILVEMNLRDRKLMDVHRLNLATGALVFDTQNPGDVVGWGADPRLQVRAAQVVTAEGGTEIRIRDTAKSPWRSWVKADAHWLVAFTSDRGPIRYYAWDRAAKKGTFLFVHQPRLEGLQLAEMKPVVIKSRDGLNLNSYLTLPVGVPARTLPMVLYVH